MKAEKICINRKTLVISLIVVFLLGVVGVSYMVQRNISLKSRASGTEVIVDKNCGLVLDIALASFFKDPTNNQTVSDFKDSHLDMNTSKEPGTTVGGCPKGQKYPFGLSTNNGENLLNPQNCCLNEFSKNNNTSIDVTLTNLGLKYNERNLLSNDAYYPFSKITAPVDKKAVVSISECIDRGAPLGSDDSKIPQPCGSNKVTEEACGPGENSRRLFKVSCGSVGTDGQTSCDFKCYNGKDWNSGCEKTNENVCLSPTPEPPAANTNNSTNQTSNQASVEVNPLCNQNTDGGKYMCYVQTELKQGSWVTDKTTNFMENGNYFIYLVKGDRKRISRPGEIGKKNNEMCKVNRDQKLTDGICATVTNQ